MRILLDSNALIWWLTRAPQLRPEAARIIASPESEVFVSTASVWELCIKAAIGKLRMPDDISAQMQHHRFVSLGITIEHALAIIDLPLIHKDPFDRMLIAQAMAEGLTVVTSDKVFAEYGIPIVAA